MTDTATALDRRELPIGAPNPTTPESSEYRIMLHQAQAAVNSGLLPKAINTPQKAITIAMRGRELGVPMFAAFTCIYVLPDGTTTLSAQLMHALVNRAYGSTSLRVIESTAERCVVIYHPPAWKREKLEPGRVEWTIEEAQKAGLATKDNWKKYPADMLTKRAISRAARLGFPEVTLGLYDPTEINPDIPVRMGEDGELHVDIPQQTEREEALKDVLNRAQAGVVEHDDRRVAPESGEVLDDEPTDAEYTSSPDAGAEEEEFAFATAEQLGTIEELHSQLGRQFEPYDMDTDEARNLILRLTAEINARKPATNGSGSKPASANQLATVSKLSRLLGRPEEIDEDMTSAEASRRITELSNEYNDRKSDAAARRR